MKITAVYGTSRKAKSSTYHIAQQFIARLSEGDAVQEFFLPLDLPQFCRGCGECFTDYTKCPDHAYVRPMMEAMNDADLLVLTAPVFVYHVPGQVKAFLDHFAFRWMVHQPQQEMFSKQALLISTAAGAGTRSTLKDLKDSLDYWGVAKVYTFGRNVRAVDWNHVDGRRKAAFERDIAQLAAKIKRDSTHVRPRLKVKALFHVMRFMQKRYGFNEADVRHWESRGWLGKQRPWHG
jgi:multimeric flavodoxin WrbA